MAERLPERFDGGKTNLKFTVLSDTAAVLLLQRFTNPASPW
jgi:hypothetical protein